jgi:hypothetical protein
MAISIEEFKSAFAGKLEDGSLAQRDQQVAAALKRLRSAVARRADEAGEGIQAALKKLVERYERARDGIGDATRDAGKELDDVLQQTESVFGRLGARRQARSAARTATDDAASGASRDAAGAREAVAEQESAETPLAREIREAIAAGGINIAMYMIGDPDSNNDREFKRQATAWAGNHGAFGLNGATPAKDYAMPLSHDPGKLVTDLLAAMQRELRVCEIIPIANVAFFSHGGQRSLQVDSQGSGGGERWASAGSKVIKDFVSAVKPSLTASAKIHLFACTAAKDRDPTKDRDDATRKDSFAEDLQEMTGAEVWGHENAAHTTGNSRLVQVDDEDGDSNAERSQIRDVFSRKFLAHVDASLTEPQMGYLDQKLKISRWIRDSLRFRGSGSRQLDRHQIFVEEISMMGFDQVFELLIASAPPGTATFRALFPEHDQIDKLVDGAAAVHAEFHKEMDEKIAAIAAARGNADFPSAS